MGCLSGYLVSSANIQKLFCGSSSTFKWSFDEFVGEQVVSPSYSFTIFRPPLQVIFLKGGPRIQYREKKISSLHWENWISIWDRMKLDLCFGLNICAPKIDKLNSMSYWTKTVQYDSFSKWSICRRLDHEGSAIINEINILTEEECQWRCTKFGTLVHWRREINWCNHCGN